MTMKFWDKFKQLSPLNKGSHISAAVIAIVLLAVSFAYIVIEARKHDPRQRESSRITFGFVGCIVALVMFVVIILSLYIYTMVPKLE